MIKANDGPTIYVFFDDEVLKVEPTQLRYTAEVSHAETLEMDGYITTREDRSKGDHPMKAMFERMTDEEKRELILEYL